MAPVEVAFADVWPRADHWSLLDEGLADEVGAAGELTDEISERFVRLATYAADTGVDGILFTFSAFGPAIEECAVRFPFPVLKPNEALMEAIAEADGQTGLIATHPQTLPAMTAEIGTLSQRPLDLEPVLVEGAWDDLKAGRLADHDTKVMGAVRKLDGCDQIALAQFSMAPLAKDIEAAAGRPVLTSPHAAVEKMKRLIEGYSNVT